MPRLSLFYRATLAVLLCTASATAAAEPARDPAAVTMLERSIAAHAAGPARVRLSYRGTTTSPDQGTAADGPARPHPWAIDLALDEAAQSFSMSSDIGIDGGFRFPRKVGFSGGKGFATRYTGEYDPLTEMPAEANGQLPHLLLRTILKNAQALRVASDPLFDRLEYGLANGTTASLQFERSTHLLVAQRRARTPSAFGDRLLEIIYGPYRRVGTTMVPQSMALRFEAPALGAFDYSLDLIGAAVGGPTNAELIPPPGARKRIAPSAEFAVERFGDNLFLLRNAATEGQFSYNVLVIAFSDHVMVVEAALNDATSRRVIDTVAELAPSKPIRTLVQTHHHGDHIGGIRTYVATGTHILAPIGTRGFIERIAASHSAVAPDTLAKAPRAVSLEEVAGDRSIADATNEVRLFDWPNDHSGRMLIVYLPRQKLLYQGDLVSAGELPINPTTSAFVDWVRDRKLVVEVIAGLHGRTLRGVEVNDLLHRGRLQASAR